MKIIGATPKQVQQALDVCNAGFYAGQLQFRRTDHEDTRVSKKTGKPLKRRYICGVLRHATCTSPGAMIYPGKRTNYADWQGHYDFMEALFLTADDPRKITITTSWRGLVKYVGLLGFYTNAGKVREHRTTYVRYAVTKDWAKFSRDITYEGWIKLGDMPAQGRDNRA